MSMQIVDFKKSFLGSFRFEICFVSQISFFVFSAMSEEGSCDDGTEGLLPESDVLNLVSFSYTFLDNGKKLDRFKRLLLIDLYVKRSNLSKLLCLNLL